ncbi:lithostathine-1-alpha-like [Gigantopelta aegis]|uniref:lithostathine-1-alpha-like n=1 Tax=Gigantopelta aegis TaxID=1735272 RepID=UPI001B88AB21|nr:lithostathine-1-alpha-like [Gigantopelta aegis]
MFVLKNLGIFVVFNYATLMVLCTEYPKCTWMGGNTNRLTAVFKGFCYMFSENELSWQNAKDECYKNGGRLADILNHETTDFINQYRKDNGIADHDAWIGLAWHKSVQRYIWTTGTHVNYKNWAHGEPSRIGIYVVVSADHGKWRNVAPPLNRGLEERYICKAGKEKKT